MTYTKAEELRARHAAGESLSSLAMEFGITRENARTIQLRRTFTSDHGDPGATWGDVLRSHRTLNPQAKLNPDAVRAIRRLWQESSLTQEEIGQRFGVGQDAVSKGIRGTTWGWVSDDEAA